MNTIHVKINLPSIDALANFSPSDRANLHREIAAELHRLADSHLADYALSHHATANRLAAKPTGNLEDAKISASSSPDSTSVSIHALGIARALGPITITPTSKAALTIPLHAIAYGRSVASLKKSRLRNLPPKRQKLPSHLFPLFVKIFIQ